jgi:type VI secretion system protein
MARPSFLDKFSRDQRRSAPSTLEHVMRNVQAVLNTKEGYGYFLPGFGLRSYTDQSREGNLVELLREELQQGILQYEPRLKDVEVEPRGRDSSLWLHFDLRARLEGQRVRLRILFDTTTGQVRLEEEEE